MGTPVSPRKWLCVLRMLSAPAPSYGRNAGPVCSVAGVKEAAAKSRTAIGGLIPDLKLSEISEITRQRLALCPQLFALKFRNPKFAIGNRLARPYALCPWLFALTSPASLETHRTTRRSAHTCDEHWRAPP